MTTALPSNRSECVLHVNKYITWWFKRFVATSLLASYLFWFSLGLVSCPVCWMGHISFSMIFYLSLSYIDRQWNNCRYKPILTKQHCDEVKGPKHYWPSSFDDVDMSRLLAVWLAVLSLLNCVGSSGVDFQFIFNSLLQVLECFVVDVQRCPNFIEEQLSIFGHNWILV